MNEAQARRYLASLANASELETSDIIRISFDDCRVDFTPVPDTFVLALQIEPARC